MPDSFTVTIIDDLGATTNQAIALNIASVDDTGTISGETNTTGGRYHPQRRLIASDLDGLTDGEYFSIESVDQTSNGAASIDPYSGDWSSSQPTFLRQTHSLSPSPMTWVGQQVRQ